MSDLLARLIAAGTPADLVAEVALAVARAEVAREVAVEDEERKERKRANNAERQRRFKARQVGAVTEGNAGNALVTEGNVTAPSLSLPPNENNSNPPTHTHPDMNTRPRKADDFPCPNGVDPIDWDALKANRKTARKPLTEGAHRAMTRKLEGWAREGWPPGPIVATAAERGWLTVFETDEMKARKNGHRTTNQNLRPSSGHGIDRRSSLTRACDEALDWLG